MLDAPGLILRHGPHEVLRLAFHALPGRLTAIVGPNGAGKTTLLRALTGERPAGPVWLNGLAMQGLPAGQSARLRAVMAQAQPLAFPFRVAELLRMGQEAGDFALSGDLADQALARVGLPGFGPRVMTRLSGGEQARVHLARALLQVWQPVGPQGPRWLFLDEPVASLDIAHQLLVMRLARDFARGGGGVVAVMHDLNLTAAFADDIWLLGHGRVVAKGSPAQVMADAPLSAAYGCALRVNAAPADQPFLLPQMAGE